MAELEDKKPQNDKAWLRPVLFFYAKVTSWIVGPLAVALILSDNYIWLVPAFLVGLYGIYREIKIYKKSIEK